MSRQYTNEEQDAMDKRAQAAAQKEYDNDPNRKDPAGVQDRVEAALKRYRQSIGLEK
jgi:hypothetical protein